MANLHHINHKMFFNVQLKNLYTKSMYILNTHAPWLERKNLFCVNLDKASV